MFKRVALALLLSPFVYAKPLKPAPAVVKTLSSRYKLPTPVSSAGMTTGARDLADYVALQQRFFPGAVVTAGFYDWRTTSRYRGHAGLHLGYDVAMPYGCQFSAGWAGTVTSIVLWSGEEYGITVQHPDGSSVTYGHVSPKVTIGQRVLPGEPIGTIAYNHVDVKMRDANGNYVDFGGNGRVLPAPQWAVEQPVASREMVMANWLLAQNTLEMAEEQYRNEKLESEKRRIQLQALRQKVPALKESQEMMAEYVEQGLVSRLTSEENHDELENAKKELARMEKARTTSPERVKQLQKDVDVARNRLNEAKKMAGERGISWKQVQAFVQATIANDRALSKNVQAYKKNALTKNSAKLASLEQELSKATDTLKTYEELFEMGGISRNELDEARTKKQILQAQVKAFKGSANPTGHD
ncbi:MAG: peptidoglycan DD-metalloendopeptidase family protein [Candidatus Eremiobacteraeota bacterium]|nr:peptidoglycan DD-metalloendopeptidase family protein [Candidatus Eremiobacteraeota bacterium]